MLVNNFLTISAVGLSNELEANLRELASAGPVEPRENGARVAPSFVAFLGSPRQCR